MSRFEFDPSAKALVFPAGGIGTGTIGFAADGGFRRWQIVKGPAIEYNGFSHALIKCVNTVDRTVNARALISDSFSAQHDACIPHYDTVTCSCQYPVATYDYISRSMPIAVTQTVFSPFIPLNVKESSLPVVMIKYTLTNLSNQPQNTTLFLSVKNPFSGSLSTAAAESEHFGLCHSGDNGALIVATDADRSQVERQLSWLDAERPEDSLNCFLTEATAKELLEPRDPQPACAATSTLAVSALLDPRENTTFRFVIAWKTDLTPEAAPSPEETVNYTFGHWKHLESMTDAFRRSLFTSTMPDVAKEAAVSVLPILKSPVYRLDENGALAVRDGVTLPEARLFNHDFYILLKLFPEIEKATLEKLMSAAASLDVETDTERLLLDVIRFYAYCRYTDDNVMRELHYGDVMSILDRFTEACGSEALPSFRQTFCDGRRLNSVNPYLSGLYLTALCAGAELARRHGDSQKQESLIRIFDNSKADFHDRLYNKDYFGNEEGKMPDVEAIWEDTLFTTDGLSAGSHLAQFYGIYHAILNDLDDVFNPVLSKHALKYIYEHHLLKDMHGVWAPAHSDADYNDGGLITCRNVEQLPLNARDQGVSRGYEYMISLLMLLYYLNDQAIDILLVSGERNTNVTKSMMITEPSPYAPTASGFDFVEFYSGFRYDSESARATFAPPFCFEDEARGQWITSTGWGSFLATRTGIVLDVFGGYLNLRELELPLIKKFRKPSKDSGYSVQDNVIVFDDDVMVKAGSRLRMQM
ncbi:MAG: hypothetical protein KIG36_03415 [Eubacteriales bacterium]|nr:hypothetical protein [Eubacteriales bacterium]